MTSTTFLTSTQLSERWQLHQQTLIKWRKTGTGPPYVKIKDKVLYKLADVEAYEKANTFPSK